ncbi:hypothetical protein ACU4GH_01430 [Bradyrhizobium betae]
MSSASTVIIKPGATALSTRGVGRPFEVLLPHLAFEEAWQVPDAVEAEMADAGPEVAEVTWHPANSASYGVGRSSVSSDEEES